MNDRLSPRDELDALIPWYVAGALDDADRKRVEQAMATDPALARSVEAARDEQAGAQILNETLPGPSRKMAARVLAVVESAPQRRDILSMVGEWMRELVAAWSPRAAGAAFAALVALFAAQTVFFGGLAWRSGGFQTASGPSVEPPARLIVRFAPEATAARIQERLLRSGLSIAGGPNADGLYRLRTAQPTDATALARLIDELKNDRDLFSLVLPAAAP